MYLLDQLPVGRVWYFDSTIYVGDRTTIMKIRVGNL